MNRTDGYRVKTNDAMYELVPYIMPKRFDASNSIKYDIDLDVLHQYIKDKRSQGIQMNHMSILIAAYLRTLSQNPLLNRFCMNKKIFARNHICVSFVTLRPGATTDTVAKIYLRPDDTIFEVNSKVIDVISAAQEPHYHSAMDDWMARLVRLPFFARGFVGLIKVLDKYFSLPFSLIHASPFHTSLFVTNLASIRTNAIFHHLYEFGTTGVFVSMGQPIKKTILDDDNNPIEEKVMELGIVTDERIANGHYYGRCFKELNRYLKNPEILETKPDSVVNDPDIRKKNPKFIVK